MAIVFRNGDVPRALVRDMYTKSWSAFDRLVAIVPPGGSIGYANVFEGPIAKRLTKLSLSLDDKLFLQPKSLFKILKLSKKSDDFTCNRPEDPNLGKVLLQITPHTELG